MFANVAVLLSVSVVCGFAQQQKLPADDLNPNLKPADPTDDFDKRRRDGSDARRTKLYTVIRVGERCARCAYSADSDLLQRQPAAERSTSGRMVEALPS